MLDDLVIEIEELDHEHVVLAIPELRLLVMGRTLAEAEALASAALEARWCDRHGAAQRPAASSSSTPQSGPGAEPHAAGHPQRLALRRT